MDNGYKESSLLLSEYEVLFEHDPNTAIKRMIDLYPKADKSFNHEVTDAIDIWVQENVNFEIVEYLKGKLSDNADLNRVYNTWISLL